MSVHLNSRQLSFCVAGLMAFSFFIFIAGYFLGQKKVLEQFSHKLEQDSLADKFSSSMYTLYDIKQDDSLELSEGEETEICDGQEEAEVAPSPKVVAQQDVVQEPSKQYYAELVGFGSLSAAQTFAQRLEKKGIMVAVKKRMSKTARGKQIAWYQVVTNTYDSHQNLMSLVDLIKRDERIRDVRIVTC